MRETLIEHVAEELRRHLDGGVDTGPVARMLYSTDASNYQIQPLGVVYPRSLDDLAAAVEIASAHGVPVLPRGSGTSLAGQVVGAALVLDCSRYLNHIIDLDSETAIATVEPGMLLGDLNRAAAAHGLQFGPDPASADRATLGGSLGNNATGAHSITYGMAADHLLSAQAVLADGSLADFSSLSLEEAARKAKAETLEGRFYQTALRIRSQYGEAVRQNWPRTWRRASGYNLNYLFPWSPSAPTRWAQGWGSGDLPYPPIVDGDLNLAALLAGSEGTLAVLRTLTLRLVPLPRHTILAVMPFESIAVACDAAPGLLQHDPSAIELIPRSLIRLARTVPAYARQFTFIQGDPAALLVVEFAGDDPADLEARARRLGPDVLLAESSEQQEQIWAVRKVGLGLLMSRPGDLKPVSFIEDLSVPVERLGEFVRAVQAILDAHGVQGDFYAHASAGCLHIRPLLSLKRGEGVATMRAIMTQVVELVIRLGGALSGEHGDGISRSEWLAHIYGPEIVKAFGELKAAADPHGILNPGKLVDAPPMDANLRYGADYRARAWEPVLDFSSQIDLSGAVEMCNGAGVCLKADGVMCPSFQVTWEEMHSTRGRANLLRAMIAGQFPQRAEAERAVHQALDLCLECKGCKAECPSAVDMAKLKYEFWGHYYQRHRRPLRDYLFAFVGVWSRFLLPLASLINLALRSRFLSGLASRILGLAPRRQLPLLRKASGDSRISEGLSGAGEQVLLLSDPFSDNFYPELRAAALRVLARAGCKVHLLPVCGAGRTYISKGFLRRAKAHAARLVATIARLDPEGRVPVIGIEPSELLTLSDEYLDFFPGDPQVRALAERSFTLAEFLLRPGPSGESRLARLKARRKPPGGAVNVLLHGHCYQKAQPPAADGYPVGEEATAQLLRELGCQVERVEAGCCGMAGAFGYEAEHYDLSMQIGELALFPAVRAAHETTRVVAPGVSCRTQIVDGSGRQAIHPVILIDELTS